MEEQTNKKLKKALGIAVNVLVAVILVLALVVTINNIASSKKGYTSLFGKAYMVCQTNSMEGEKPAEYPDKPEGFAVGDLLRVRILSDEEKEKLEEGDIISFYAVVGNQRVINSHRIIAVSSDSDGIYYTTRGDNLSLYSEDTPHDTYKVYAHNESQYYNVIGIVEGNLGGIGNVFKFFNSSTGFLVCIVVPSFLVVLYFGYIFVSELVKRKRATAGAEEKEKLKEELMAELRAQGMLNDGADGEEEKPDGHDGADGADGPKKE